MQLRKLTTRYVANEDRFLISAEGDRGHINLWLTQRLIKSLLPHLLEWLGSRTVCDDDGSDQVSASSAANTSDNRSQNSSATNPQLASQLVAQTRKAVSQVDASKATQSILVQTIQFQPRDDILRLIFELPNEEAILLLQSEHLRIWLSALYNGWQQANWPDLWPDWMKQAHLARSQYPAPVMH